MNAEVSFHTKYSCLDNHTCPEKYVNEYALEHLTEGITRQNCILENEDLELKQFLETVES